MRQELSYPLAFFAILNLYNEQNLKLMGQSDLQNFTIKNAECFDSYLYFIDWTIIKF